MATQSVTMDAEGVDNVTGHKNMLQLIQLRWIAVVGQLLTVGVVHYAFAIPLPLKSMLGVLAALAVFNIVSMVRWRSPKEVTNRRLFVALLVDVATLTAQLFLSGGASNPFVFLYLLQVNLGAVLLSPRATWTLVGITIGCFGGLAVFGRPLALPLDQAGGLSSPYVQGMLISFALDAALLVIFITRIGGNLRERDARLAGLRQRAAEEEHVVRMGLLASGAAHELGTPLSTISVIAKELERAIEPNSPHADDVKLLQEQSQRCRSILAKLTELPSSGPFDSVPLSALIEEVVAPHRNFGVAINIDVSRDSTPVGARNPAILYGLGNLLENAVDFAQERVEVTADWTEDDVSVVISDDGPGFAPEILDRIGEPYVRSSKRRRMYAGSETTGLGLGFFIAKTLLERSGATLEFENRVFPDRGAVVKIRWDRTDFERPLALPLLES